MAYTYYRLLDSEYNGLIVRADDGLQQYYDQDTKGWVDTGIMLFYFSDESDTYGMYEELTEEQALELISK